MNGNEITIIGNLTREPELRYTAGGKGVCSFSVASNRRYQRNGEWVSDTVYFDCSAWDALGENIAASFGKGNSVIVIGRMSSRKYEGKDGVERTAWDVTVEECGVSLRWARATVEKVTREQAEDRPAYAPADDRPSMVHSGPDPVYGDEPF